MELSKLKYFHAVAKLGSFTAAAREIHVSQPSLSKMVQQLESDLGSKLFIRGKKGVDLTPAGKLVYEKSQSIFQQIETLKVSLSEIDEEVSGDLAIGASDNLCNYILPVIFDEIARSFPKVRIKLFSGTSSEIQNELSKGRIELGFFYTKIPKSLGFDVRPLSFVEFVVVAKKELTLKDLSQISYLGSRKADYKGYYPALEMLKSINVSPKILFETNNQETQKKMAMLGCGYTVIPIHMVESELAERSLYRVSAGKKLGSEVFIVKKSGKSISKPAQVLEKTLVLKMGFPR